jgi:hypothetical protein
MNDKENRRDKGKPDEDTSSPPKDFVRMREWIRQAQAANRAERTKRDSQEKEESTG